MIVEALNILDLIQELGESFVENQLSLFSCPNNPDIENFLKRKAIDFAKKGISITYLVFARDETENTHLVGYYTLTYKIIHISRIELSKTTEKRISRFGNYDSRTQTYSVAAPLIAQFGKNYNSMLTVSISGHDLMNMVLDQLQRIQYMIGGRIIYLECEDNPFLLDFYGKEGFIPFDKRYTEREEDTQFYYQMFRIVK